MEDDPTNPLSVCGKTKLAGEEAIRQIGVPHLILHTAWVFGTRGRKFPLIYFALGFPTQRAENCRRSSRCTCLVQGSCSSNRIDSSEPFGWPRSLIAPLPGGCGGTTLRTPHRCLRQHRSWLKSAELTVMGRHMFSWFRFQTTRANFDWIWYFWVSCETSNSPTRSLAHSHVPLLCRLAIGIFAESEYKSA